MKIELHCKHTVEYTKIIDVDENLADIILDTKKWYNKTDDDIYIDDDILYMDYIDRFIDTPSNEEVECYAEEASDEDDEQ